MKDSKLFVCKVYRAPNVTSVNKERELLFVQFRAPERLPPTSDSLSFHIRRAHYQTALWRHANKRYLPPRETMGWRLEDSTLLPILMSLPPVPDYCLELISCTSRYMSARCKCKKSRLRCFAACKCKTSDTECSNC